MLKVNRINGYRGFNFKLELELHPYIGPHINEGTNKVASIVFDM
ncbi:TPA: DUF3888 domain-containing protein [Clostridium botulinum]|nr:DUF3888 domain-containing protein [Clostridium botulinum]